MTIMFEVQDLAVASPATVSRCGMVYLEPSILGLSPFVSCWLRRLPDTIKPHKDTLHILSKKFLEVLVHIVCKYGKSAYMSAYMNVLKECTKFVNSAYRLHSFSCTLF